MLLIAEVNYEILDQKSTHNTPKNHQSPTIELNETGNTRNT